MAPQPPPLALGAGAGALELPTWLDAASPGTEDGFGDEFELCFPQPAALDLAGGRIAHALPPPLDATAFSLLSFIRVESFLVVQVRPLSF